MRCRSGLPGSSEPAPQALLSPHRQQVLGPISLFFHLVTFGLPLAPSLCGQAAEEGRPDPRRLMECSFEDLV